MTGSDSRRDVLYERVVDELARAGTKNDVTDLVLAALESDAELAGKLSGSARSTPDGAGPTANPVEGPDAVPGMYLMSISVRGFRGIGAEATLKLKPGHGLTLVSGRNGSGKSSFAEAAELGLTGTNERVKRDKAQRDGWRNLHSGQSLRLQVELAVEGHEQPVTVERSWVDSGDRFEAAATVLKENGRSPRPGTEPGWGPALNTSNPFLAYVELSTLVTGGGSKAFDRIDPILGLGELTAAEERLRLAARDIEDGVKTVKAERDELMQDLKVSADPRAALVTEALTAGAWTGWNLPAAEAAADAEPGTGLGDDAAVQARLVSQLTIPARADVTTRAGALRSAAARVAELPGTPAAEARRPADLLTAGLEHHAAHGDGPCPLCGAGALDDAWRQHAVRQAEQLAAAAESATAANDALRYAVAVAHALAGEPPPRLDPVISPLAETARTAWHRWAELRVITEPRHLADELERRHPPLATAIEELRAAGNAHLNRVNVAWQPLAKRVLELVERSRAAHARRPRTTHIRKARAFLKETISLLRTERLAPLETQMRENWADLRQESNVQFLKIKMTGAGTSRRLVADVAVDGLGGSARQVMSQGELHALGLALFLPRATVADSPFRFVVIDDPVQAMDPAKVDGLARVLLRTAQTRQVVVFTHDDRLANALRRISPRGAPTWFLEVVRRENSRVEVREALDPATRCLNDAWDLSATPQIPDDIKDTLVPSFCKTAIDAACVEVIRRRRLGRGARHQDVEGLLLEAAEQPRRPPWRCATTTP